MDISFINPLLNILSVCVNVEDPLILVAVTLSSHLDVEKPVIWGKIRIIYDKQLKVLLYTDMS